MDCQNTITNKQRDSTVEMLRIFAMLVIIAGHFGVHGIFHIPNSAQILCVDKLSWQLIFTQFISCGGSLGNRIFLLITGYFMIVKSLSYKKIFRLFSKMIFYSWLILLVVYCSGLLPVSKDDVFRSIIPIWFGENWFISCYIIFSLFIPYINFFLNKLSEKSFRKMLIIIYFLVIVIPGLKGVTFMNSQMIYFFLVYSIGGYIRLHYNNLNISIKPMLCFILTIAIINISIVLFDYIGFVLKNDFFVKSATHINVFLHIPAACFIFLWVNTKGIFYIQKINILSQSILGVYLIHDNFLIRTIIWDKIFKNDYFLTSSFYVIFALVKILSVFIICIIVDKLISEMLDRFEFYCLCFWNKVLISLNSNN